MPILHNMFTIIGTLIKMSFLLATVTEAQLVLEPVSIIPEKHPNGTRVTLQINLREFSNEQGIDINGRRCDLATQCNVTFYAYLDQTNASAPWPGAANTTNLQRLHRRINNNLFEIDKTFNYTVCAKSEHLPMVNLRVKVDDHDIFTRDDSIERFSCIIPSQTFPVADLTPEKTPWSADTDCQGKVHPLTKVRLSFRYRYFQTKPSEFCT